MISNVSWKKIIRTVSGGDYAPEASIPNSTSEGRRELLVVPVPIELLPPAEFLWITSASNFLERHRKTAVILSGLVILGTYGPAVKDVCNIVGEVLVVHLELDSPLRRPAWVIEGQHIMARLKARKALTKHKSSLTHKNNVG